VLSGSRCDGQLQDRYRLLSSSVVLAAPKEWPLLGVGEEHLSSRALHIHVPPIQYPLTRGVSNSHIRPGLGTLIQMMMKIVVLPMRSAVYPPLPCVPRCSRGGTRVVQHDHPLARHMSSPERDAYESPANKHVQYDARHNHASSTL
jgi:hypothetical protein